jgi:predicted outer membrane repeat protein
VEIVAGSNARHFKFSGKASDNAAFSLASLTFTGGNVTGDGGAILVNGQASVSIDNCSFLGNRAGNRGGAINVESGNTELLVSSTTFAGNSAGNGGAVRMTGSGAQALFVNTTFSGNSASGFGGAVNAVNCKALDLLACTFADNTAANGPSLSVGIPVRAVNCIFAAQAGSGGAVAHQFQGTAPSTDWCSVDADSAKVFAGGGAAVTQVVAGVTHVVHPPLGGAAAGNEDAAEIYHDPEYQNVRAVGRDGREVVYAGNRDAATIPFIVDQLSAVRTAPTRGAVRLAVGTEPVTVELDGVLLDAAGNPRPNAKVDTAATVFYDSGEAVATNLTIRTADYGIFGLSVPVDGSDGLAHNVTGIVVRALGPDSVAVATAPYALTAASVDLIGSNDYLPLYGDAIAIGNVAAMSISATNSFDARAAGTFTAGELKGFKQIDLEHVAVSGGALDWLGGAHPAAQSGPFANLAEMTIGGGVEGDLSGTVTAVKGKTETFRVGQAAHDGFLQLQARCQNPQNGELQIDVVEGDKVVLNVTPRGRVSRESGVLRRLVWTIPVKAGQKVRLTMYGVDGAFELSSVKAQFIYFGVPE